MTLKQAYIAAFCFLKPYWDETKSEEIVDLLSCMNPFFWADGNSADPATFDDWQDCAVKAKIEEPLDAERAFNLMLEFLAFHRDEFAYAPQWLIGDVANRTCNSSEWLTCIADSVKHG